VIRALVLERLMISLFLVSTAPSANAQWAENGVPVTTASGSQRYPVMVSDGQGGMFIAWQDLNLPDRLFVQRIGPDGRPAPGWPGSGTPLPSSCPITGVGIVSDDAGGVFLAFRGCDPQVPYYVQRVTANGSIAPGWPTEGQPLPRVPYLPGTGGVLTDGAGGLFGYWSHFYQRTDGDGRTIRATDIFLQRTLSSGAVAPGWPTEGRAVSQGVEVVSGILAVSDHLGGVMVGYNLFDGLYQVGSANVERVNGSGTTSYHVNVGCFIADSYSSQAIRIYADGSGGAIVPFRQFTRVGELIHTTAQRLDEFGGIVANWAPTCQPFFGTALGGPLIVTDGGTGVFFAWGDTRASPEPDIYG